MVTHLSELGRDLASGEDSPAEGVWSGAGHVGVDVKEGVVWYDKTS